MALASSRIFVAIRHVLRTSVGKRFSRFIPVAAASLGATMATLDLLLVLGVTSGIAGVIGAMAGAAVSYVLSRWAWERKGRPNLLKETVPFWLVAMSAWAVLGLTSHYSSVWAYSMGLKGLQRVALVDGAYLVANCVTFVGRFLIFHYLLFVDRPALRSEAPEAGPSGRVSLRGSAVRASAPSPRSGAPSWDGGAAADRSPGWRSGVDTGPLPDPGSRR